VALGIYGNNKERKMTNTIALKSFIERIQRLETNATEIREDIKEVYLEAKSSGFDIKGIKAVIALMKKDSDEVAQEEAILALYKKELNI
jgi:uncharacterized protein (UPF0335 family)